MKQKSFWMGLLILVTIFTSCETHDAKRTFFPHLNYYIIEYGDNKMVISHKAGNDTLEKVNSEIYTSDGKLLLSNMQDTTFIYYVDGYMIKRTIVKTDSGHVSESQISYNQCFIELVKLYYNDSYEINMIYKIEKIDYLPQKYNMQRINNIKGYYYYPRMKKPKTFYAGYLSGKLILGSSSNKYLLDTFDINNKELRGKDGALFLSSKGDTIIRSNREDGMHIEEIYKKSDDEFVYSNYLKRESNTHYSGNANEMDFLCVSYTYTNDFHILKRQSFEEVIYLPQKE